MFTSPLCVNAWLSLLPFLSLENRFLEIGTRVLNTTETLTSQDATLKTCSLLNRWCALRLVLPPKRQKKGDADRSPLWQQMPIPKNKTLPGDNP
jgi:hypothetical protein